LHFARIVPFPKAVIGPTPLQFIRQIGPVQITLDGSASLPEPEELQFQWVLPQDVVNQSGIPGGQNSKTLTIQYSGEPRKIDVQLVVKDSFGRQNVQTIGISVI